MKNSIVVMLTILSFASVANAGCEGKFKPAIKGLGHVNGETFRKVSAKPELIEETKYTSTYQGTAIDSNGNRIVFEVETKKTCEVIRIQSLGET